MISWESIAPEWRSVIVSIPTALITAAATTLLTDRIRYWSSQRHKLLDEAKARKDPTLNVVRTVELEDTEPEGSVERWLYKVNPWWIERIGNTASIRDHGQFVLLDQPGLQERPGMPSILRWSLVEFAREEDCWICFWRADLDLIYLSQQPATKDELYLFRNWSEDT